jgi:hypothetical protein
LDPTLGQVLVADPKVPFPDPAHEAISPHRGSPRPIAASVSGGGPGKAGVGTDRPTGTAFFGAETAAQTIVYVIDRSASMGPVAGSAGGFAAALEELQASLEKLPETARFQVILYNLVVEVLPIGGRTCLVRATQDNKREAVALAGQRAAEGRTDHLPPLLRALSLRPDVIFFLTDADDLTDEQVRRVTRINDQQNRSQTVIHAIELNPTNPGRADTPLQLLARSNHGQYRALRSADGR